VWAIRGPASAHRTGCCTSGRCAQLTWRRGVRATATPSPTPPPPNKGWTLGPRRRAERSAPTASCSSRGLRTVEGSLARGVCIRRDPQSRFDAAAASAQLVARSGARRCGDRQPIERFAATYACRRTAIQGGQRLEPDEMRELVARFSRRRRRQLPSALRPRARDRRGCLAEGRKLDVSPWWPAHAPPPSGCPAAVTPGPRRPHRRGKTAVARVGPLRAQSRRFRRCPSGYRGLTSAPRTIRACSHVGRNLVLSRTAYEPAERYTRARSARDAGGWLGQIRARAANPWSSAGRGYT